VPGDISGFAVLKTIFLVKEGGGLAQLLNVQIDNSGPVTAGNLLIELAGSSRNIELPRIRHGLDLYPVTVPEVTSPTLARFVLEVGATRLESEVMLDRVRHWQVYLTHFSHHDLGYTDLPEACIQAHKDYYNSIIEYCRQTEDFPDDAKFRWTCDTTWAVKYYLQDASERQIAAFFDLVRDGRIEITAQYAAFNSALLTHEELVRSIYYAHELGRKYGFRVTSAMTTDIPGHPWGFPQVLAKSGVRYLATAVNQDWAQDGVPRAKVPRVSRPFYWSSADGSEVLVWNSDPKYIYTEGRELGLTYSYDRAMSRLPAYLKSLEDGGYQYDAINLRTTWKGADNAPPCISLSRIVRQWNEKWAYPKLRVATSSQFFEYMEREYGDRFPHYTGDWTDWWIDGPGSSAYETGITRVAHEELASAEKLAALTLLLGEGRPYPKEAIEQAYDNLMLYDEHTWGMWNNVSDPYLPTTEQEWATKAAFANDAVRQSRGLLDEGIAWLGRQVRSDESALVVVFNALSWPRTDVVRVRLDPTMEHVSRPFRLLDAAGEAVPYQLIESHKGGSLTIAFVARDVPSCGYKSYRLVPGAAATDKQPSFRAEGNVLENSFYRVTLDERTGAIASVWDKELRLELVDQASCYKLNQYVYDAGEPPINGRFFAEAMGIHGSGSGAVYGSAVAIGKCRIGRDARLSWTNRGRVKEAADISPWIRQEVILYEDIKRIDLVNRLYKEETLEKEGLYYAFPFLVKDGAFKLEIAGGPMRPGEDQLPDSCHDWHSVQYWLDVTGPECGVTWSSREVPVVSLGDINTGKWQSDLRLDNTTFFAYAMNNYWATNFKERQGGDFTFRFSFTSHGPGWGVADANRFGWGYCTDLQAVVVPPGQAGRLAGSTGSFVEIDAPNVMLFTLKGAEDGDGLVVRLLELEGRATTARLSTSPRTVSQAFRTDMVERNLEPLPVSGGVVTVPVPGRGIESVRLRV